MNGYGLIAALVLAVGISLIVIALRVARLTQPSGAARAGCRVGIVWGGLLVGAITTLVGVGMLIPPI